MTPSTPESHLRKIEGFQPTVFLGTALFMVDTLHKLHNLRGAVLPSLRLQQHGGWPDVLTHVNSSISTSVIWEAHLLTIESCKGDVLQVHHWIPSTHWGWR
ncbi:unnamed protein product [Choristocarpus tenellus]